jgi:hypothetical protein
VPSFLIHPVLRVAVPGARYGTSGQIAVLNGLSSVRTSIGPTTLLAPVANDDGSAFLVEDADGSASTNPITLHGNGRLIDGAVSIVLDVPRVAAAFVLDGGEWRRVEVLRAFDDDIPVASVTRAAVGGTAVTLAYAPAVVADWNPAPDDVAEALDQIARTMRTSTLLWGNLNVGTTATPRFLTPGYDSVTAPTQDVTFDLSQDCAFDRMRIRVRNGGTTGAQDITYTLRLNNLDTLLAVTMPATSQVASNLVNEALGAAGDRATIRITKPAGIATSPTDVECSIRMRSR